MNKNRLSSGTKLIILRQVVCKMQATAFLNYQTAPIMYTAIIIMGLLTGRMKYQRLQVGN